MKNSIEKAYVFLKIHIQETHSQMGPKKLIWPVYCFKEKEWICRLYRAEISLIGQFYQMNWSDVIRDQYEIMIMSHGMVVEAFHPTLTIRGIMSLFRPSQSLSKLSPLLIRPKKIMPESSSRVWKSDPGPVRLQNISCSNFIGQGLPFKHVHIAQAQPS